MDLRQEHFNKEEVNDFHADQFCDFCSHRIKDMESIFISNPYYAEDRKICERCYLNL